MSFIYQYVICAAVIFFVGLSLHTTPLISLLSGLFGALGYSVYLLCPEAKTGFFLSALVLTLLAECLARLCEKPATIFIVLGIYPLVPGIALYQTMAYAVQGDYVKALTQGGEALVCIVLMTVAIALVPAIFRILLKHRKKQNENR